MKTTRTISKGALLGLVLVLSACASGMQIPGLGGGGSIMDHLQSGMDIARKLDKASEELSDEQQYYLGRSVSAKILAQYQPLRNDAVNRYVNRVGSALVAVSDRPEIYGGYHFLVLSSSEVNAMAAPGGYVFLTSGLLKIAPDEDSLAAVLAHEIGHIVHDDGVNAISNANLSSALMAGLGEAAKVVGENQGAVTAQLVNAFSGSVTDVTDKLITKGYGRSQEYDADEYAVELMKRAGYNPQAMITLLKKMDSMGKAGQGGWFATHPAPDDRLDEVEGEIDSDAPPSVGQTVRAERFARTVKSVS